MPDRQMQQSAVKDSSCMPVENGFEAVRRDWSAFRKLIFSFSNLTQKYFQKVDCKCLLEMTEDLF